MRIFLILAWNSLTTGRKEMRSLRARLLAEWKEWMAESLNWDSWAQVPNYFIWPLLRIITTSSSLANLRKFSAIIIIAPCYCRSRKMSYSLQPIQTPRPMKGVSKMQTSLLAHNTLAKPIFLSSISENLPTSTISSSPFLNLRSRSSPINSQMAFTSSQGMLRSQKEMLLAMFACLKKLAQGRQVSDPCSFMQPLTVYSSPRSDLRKAVTPCPFLPKITNLCPLPTDISRSQQKPALAFPSIDSLLNIVIVFLAIVSLGSQSQLFLIHLALALQFSGRLRYSLMRLKECSPYSTCSTIFKIFFNGLQHIPSSVSNMYTSLMVMPRSQLRSQMEMLIATMIGSRTNVISKRE